MKKLITLSALFALSGAAVAAFQPSNAEPATDGATPPHAQAIELAQQAVEQMPPQANSEATPPAMPQAGNAPAEMKAPEPNAPKAAAENDRPNRDGKPMARENGKRGEMAGKMQNRRDNNGRMQMQQGLPAGHPPVSAGMTMPRNHPQGFMDPATLVKDSKAALEAKDRSAVTLEGNITKQVNDDEYTFVDSTGSIKVEIPRSAWKGQIITPQDKIRIEGILDKQWEVPEIKVKRLNKID